MADNVVLNPGTNGATMRTLADTNGAEWPAAVVCYATTLNAGANVLQVVTPTAGMPVAATTNLNTAALALEAGGNLAGSTPSCRRRGRPWPPPRCPWSSRRLRSPP